MEHTETLTITAMTYGPYAIARRSDGKAVFVPGAAPGDVVEVAYCDEKDTFAYAELTNIIETGEHRQTPHPHLATLGSAAPWAHLSYAAQLSAKRTNVVEQLVRTAKLERTRAESLVETTAASPRQEGYRNKIELAVASDTAGRLTVGHSDTQTGAVTPIASMPLAHREIAAAPKKIQGALRYLEGGQPGRLGIYRIGIRHSTRTGACEVALWTTPGAFPRKEVARVIDDALSVTSITRVIADKGKARKIKNVEALSGDGHWRERVSGYQYRVSSPSFFQVNTEQADVLVQTTLQGLGVGEGSRVADLYCGVGTFTLPLAGLGCDVSAVESEGTAVRDLRRNAESEGLFIDIIGGDSARELPELGKLDALIVDPPRAGLAKGVAEDIAAATPARMAYVSCDPATWARDVARLEQCGYTLERVIPVDLFPHTYHCELVSFFTCDTTHQ